MVKKIEFRTHIHAMNPEAAIINAMDESKTMIGTDYRGDIYHIPTLTIKQGPTTITLSNIDDMEHRKSFEAFMESVRKKDYDCFDIIGGGHKHIKTKDGKVWIEIYSEDCDSTTTEISPDCLEALKEALYDFPTRPE